MLISDWSSDVCSSDLSTGRGGIDQTGGKQSGRRIPKSSSTEFECRNASCTKTSASFTRNSSSSNSNSPAYTEIGRASCRERVYKYVKISEDAVSVNKKQNRRD